MNITREEMKDLVGGWISAGKRAFGPRRLAGGFVQYGTLQSPGELLFDGFIRPENSIKEVVFPRHEVLYRYRIDGQRMELYEDEFNPPPTLVICARPCDAAALPILDAVMNWDYKDEFYNRRRAATTVVTLACAEKDPACFCTQVGLAPDADRGSDVVLSGSGPYEVRCYSEKGARLFDAPVCERQPLKPAPVRSFDFDSPRWKDASLRCLGCGACAYTCPTCHCFDIVDEKSARVRNWDSCQFGMFTLHASGHNPRTAQPQRQRQRILHKFKIYPEKFHDVLCTGCGNCVRNCPVNLGVLNVLTAVEHG